MTMKSLISTFLTISFLLILTGGCSSNNNKQIPMNGKSINSSEKSLQPIKNNSKIKGLAPEVEETLKPFGPKDMEILGLKLDMEEKEVVDLLAKPEKMDKEYSDALDGYNLYYYYPKSELVFDELDGEFRLAIIRINKQGINAPRNIQVGDSINSVLHKFPYEDNPIKNGARRVYDEVYSNGQINYDKAGKISEIVYIYGSGGNGDIWLRFKVTENRVAEIELGIQNI